MSKIDKEKDNLISMIKEDKDKDNLISMLKYIFINSDKLNQIQICLSKINGDVGDNVDSDDKQLIQTLFKKINILFKIFKLLLKKLILRVDDEIYQMIEDHEMKIPEDVEQLSLLIGTFYKSFSDTQIKLLFDIIDFKQYKSFINISEINYLMIPFVANTSVNYNKLFTDFTEFSILIRDLACDVLSLNTDLENESIIE